jgi:DNA polymerase
MSRAICPNCGHLLISSTGNIKSPILLVGEFPGVEEIKQGRAFVGRTGEVLQTELARQGIQMATCYLTNLWQHVKNEKGCDVRWHLDQLMKEFPTRTHILLMGSDVSQAILGSKVMALSGLRVEVPDFKKIHVWVSPNPAVVFRSPIGELRLALERFCADIRK